MIKPPVQRESANGGWKGRGGGQTKLLTNQEGVRAKLLVGYYPVFLHMTLIVQRPLPKIIAQTLKASNKRHIQYTPS